ncbi:MAG: hypothetical protein FD124_1925 [Alphaproteobacteria bacterium]|nr:MAG: hypothetical protein FD160_690 [Caulobacteraceae bacterium]TPW05957.1 MAG: hypothetical protein FD124_1925 [Alphaproteobacteria bacterium]
MAGVRGFWVRAALVLSLLVPVWFAAAALGTKYGVIDWRFGLGVMTLKFGPLLLVGALGFAVIGLLLALVVAPRRGRLIAMMAVLIPAAGLGYALYLKKSVADIPPIHDVSTDLVDPPGFSQAVVDARGKVSGGNALDLLTATIPPSPNFPAYGGKAVREVHAEAYSDLKSTVSDVSPNDIFQIVLDAAKAQGWAITKSDAAAGVIEAQSQSFWFGFIDDIAIRIRPLSDGTGSVIDVRSVSRVGLSDLGMNARRVRAFQTDLNTRLNEAATG